MIFEIRSYQLLTEDVQEFERRFGEGYVHRKRYSPLTALWHTAPGGDTISEVVHVWPYADLGERSRLRAQAAQDPHWPPPTGEFVTQMQVELVVPFDLAAPPPPSTVGPVFEIERDYFRVSDLGAATSAWQSAIAQRSRHATLVLAGRVEFGQTNGILQIWAYRSLAHRAQSLEAPGAGSARPPCDGPRPLAHASRMLSPAAFSPLQ